jgi:hypothetical protein
MNIEKEFDEPIPDKTKIPIKAILLSLLIGIIIGSYTAYNAITTNYVEVHPSEVGGFVFKDNKVYNLCEVNGFDVKMVMGKH